MPRSADVSPRPGASRGLVYHGNFLGLRWELPAVLPAALPLAGFDIHNRQKGCREWLAAHLVCRADL